MMSRASQGPQSLQKSSIKEYALNHIGTLNMIKGIPGPPKEPKIMPQCPKIDSTGSIGSIILGPFGGPGIP